MRIRLSIRIITTMVALGLGGCAIPDLFSPGLSGQAACSFCDFDGNGEVRVEEHRLCISTGNEFLGQPNVSVSYSEAQIEEIIDTLGCNQ